MLAGGLSTRQGEEVEVEEARVVMGTSLQIG